MKVMHTRVNPSYHYFKELEPGYKKHLEIEHLGAKPVATVLNAVVFCSVSRFRPPTSQFQLPISLVLASKCSRDIQIIARIRCTAISLGNRTTQPNSPMCIPREYARETRRLDIESICADLGLAKNVAL